MATYQETFFAQFQRSGNQYRIELHELTDGTPVADEISAIMLDAVSVRRRSGGKEGNDDLVVLGTELEFNFYSTVEDNSKYDVIYAGNWKQWRVKYFRDGTLVWQGYVKPENITREFIDEQYELRISATDGLADLKTIEYLNFSTGSNYTGHADLLTTIKRCLEHLEIELDIKVQLSTYEVTTMTNLQCPIKEVTLDSGRFTKTVDGRNTHENCLSVLEETLRPFGAVMFQDDGLWWIQSKQERNSPVFLYAYSTLLQTSRTVTDVSVDISAYKYTNKGDFQRYFPVQKHETTFQNTLAPGSTNLVPNGDFSSVSDWISSGLTSFNITGGEGVLVDSSGTGYIESGLFELSSIPANGEVTIFWRSKNVVQNPSGDPFYSPIIRCKLFYGSTEVIPSSTADFFLFEGAEYVAHSVVFPISADSVAYKVRFYLEENVTLYTSVTVKIDDVISQTNYESPSDSVTDLLLSLENDDVISAEFTEDAIWFGDSNNALSEGSLKVGATPTVSWHRYGKTDNITIQELHSLEKLVNRASYKDYLRLSVYDVDDLIRVSNRIKINTIYYRIISFSKSQITRMMELELEELITVDPANTSKWYPLTSVDGESTGTSTGAAQVTTIDWSNVANTPTTLAGYGISDARTKAESNSLYADQGHNHDGTYEPASAFLTKSNVAETITANWLFSGTPSFSGVPTFDNVILPFAVVAATGMVANLDVQYLNGKEDTDFELAIGTKNTAFNKNFGTTGTTVAYGNHTHAGFTQDSANEVISGAWTFTGIAEFGVAPQFTAATGAPFTVAATATTMVANLNADMLDGSHASAFSLSGHNHSGVYEPADANITKDNETENITGAWTFDALGTLDFNGTPDFNGAIIPFTVAVTTGMVSNLDSNYLNGKSDTDFELAIGAKNTAFNKNFGTTGTTVAYGNHVHSGFTVDSANEVISGAWTFTGIAEFGVAPQFTAATGAPFTVAATATTVVTNLNADMLDGSHSSAFSLSGHTHAGYEPADANITKDNEVETITANWIFSNTPNFTGVPNFSNAVLPFTVHANANLVTNLNADLLDGQHGSAFATATSNLAVTGNWSFSNDLGVGDATPSYRLDVREDSNSLLTIIRASNQDLGTSAAAQIYVNALGNNVFLTSYGDNHSTNANLSRLYTSAGGTSISIDTSSIGQLFIETGGRNIGMGTTTPKAYINTSSSYYLGGTPATADGGINNADNFLTISGSAGTLPVLNLESSVNSAGAIIGGVMFSRTLGNTDAHRNVAGMLAKQGNATTGTAGAELVFYVKAGGGPYEAMRIDEGGGVGIGTSTPSSLLDVNGSLSASTITEGGTLLSAKYEPYDVNITKDNVAEAVTAAWNFSGVPYFSNAILPFSVHSTSGNVQYLDADMLDGLHATSFARMSQTNTGYFHVTATSSLAAIRARQDGTGYLQDWYDGASVRAYMTQAGLLVSDDFKGLSDERLKDKVKKVRTKTLYDKVLRISKLIRIYERVDKNNETELGWIAQKLYKEAPEYVHKPDNKDEMWAVGYSKMVVPLYAAVSDIDSRLKRIENKIGL